MTDAHKTQPIRPEDDLRVTDARKTTRTLRLVHDADDRDIEVYEDVDTGERRVVLGKHKSAHGLATAFEMGRPSAME